MEFVHIPYCPGETIAAIATPPGEGGVAIIRISGNEALIVADRIFSGPVHKYASHTAHFGSIYNESKQHIDDVLLLPMIGKRSYTGENTVEIHCHGGSLVTRKVLEVVLKAGARAAKPGEFTFRAFINGKIDLTQAEAVQSLISARNEHALDAADNQLQGILSQQIKEFQKDLTVVTAILEAWVDFPEEGLEFSSFEEMDRDLENICIKIEKLAATFHEGKIVHEGLSLCLVGCPNVGKSSLLNALLNKDRAIVSPIAGTTRDILEDHLRLNGLHFKVSDTAGIRETDEGIEKEGIRRSKQAIHDADIILFILDAHKGFKEEDQKLFDFLPREKTIIVWNKIDLVHESLPNIDSNHIVFVSAQNRLGLAELHNEIDQLIWKKGPPTKEEILVTQVRHQEALLATAKAIRRVQSGLKEDVSPEFLTSDMRQALFELGKILGTNISEDILSAIFSKFCIGK